ncbi:hypothetical protein NDU88_002925 [Pleurodeles waltl]|uniref:Uncharacterized protein n=1 Tax=Pleurodeles waltl TaxID=8319 RepID=A0AAV7T4S6_PLEWA|nr:hypothetical protein NDU88_002925 [Pleurodeles waltl]
MTRCCCKASEEVPGPCRAQAAALWPSTPTGGGVSAMLGRGPSVPRRLAGDSPVVALPGGVGRRTVFPPL